MNLYFIYLADEDLDETYMAEDTYKLPEAIPDDDVGVKVSNSAIGARPQIFLRTDTGLSWTSRLATINEERKRLGQLKKRLAELSGAAGGSKVGDAKKSYRITLKTPKVCL